MEHPSALNNKEIKVMPKKTTIQHATVILPIDDSCHSCTHITSPVFHLSDHVMTARGTLLLFIKSLVATTGKHMRMSQHSNRSNTSSSALVDECEYARMVYAYMLIHTALQKQQRTDLICPRALTTTTTTTTTSHYEIYHH